jgi:hypothetical protein
MSVRKCCAIDGTYVFGGCGQQKADVDESVPAEDLYISGYL